MNIYMYYPSRTYPDSFSRGRQTIVFQTSRREPDEDELMMCTDESLERLRAAVIGNVPTGQIFERKKDGSRGHGLLSGTDWPIRDRDWRILELHANPLTRFDFSETQWAGLVREIMEKNRHDRMLQLMDEHLANVADPGGFLGIEVRQVSVPTRMRISMTSAEARALNATLTAYFAGKIPPGEHLICEGSVL